MGRPGWINLKPLVRFVAEIRARQVIRRSHRGRCCEGQVARFDEAIAAL